MIVDGERLKALVNDAQSRVLLCAPFIKVGVLRTILSIIDEGVTVRIITRWRAAEVAAGVSDLEVFEIANDRRNTELALLDDLHAKLFLADDKGFAGSANLTAAALGWSEKSNVELLLPVRHSDTEVARLLRRLEHAAPATYAVRSAVEAEAATINTVGLDEGQDTSDIKNLRRSHAWLPSFAAPGSLRTIYEDAQTTAVVQVTREDGLADLRDLQIPNGLSNRDFEEAICDMLLLMPAFRYITDHIPQGLTDSLGIELVSNVRPDLDRSNATLQWRIIRDWISVFFQDTFQVAPESFVVRLKPR